MPTSGKLFIQALFHPLMHAKANGKVIYLAAGEKISFPKPARSPPHTHGHKTKVTLKRVTFVKNGGT